MTTVGQINNGKIEKARKLFWFLTSTLWEPMFLIIFFLLSLALFLIRLICSLILSKNEPLLLINLFQ